MSIRPNQNRIMTGFIAISLITHLLVLFPLGKLGRYDFAKPVEPIAAYLVDLAPSSEAAGKKGSDAATQKDAVSNRSASTPSAVRKEAQVQPQPHHPGAETTAPAPQPAKPVQVPAAPETVADASDDGEEVEEMEAPEAVAAAPVQKKEEPEAVAAAPVQKKEEPGAHAVAPPAPPAQASAKLGSVPVAAAPLRRVEEFVGTQQETLNYRISMFGIPVGTAELEAKREQGDLRITLRMNSSPAMSAMYPVDDFVETHHIGGNFIVTKIKQREGSFKSDRGFTLFLREKTVFWRNNLKNTSLTETVPTSQVLDVLSSVYLLRKKELKVGTTEQLPVYDSDTYSVMPVQVLRKERVSLPGFREADALVVKPTIKSGGIFKRTGDLLIWLTDDENRVPVKIETRIALGKVTVELVSAQAKRDAPPAATTASKSKVPPASP